MPAREWRRRKKDDDQCQGEDGFRKDRDGREERRGTAAPWQPIKSGGVPKCVPTMTTILLMMAAVMKK